MSCECESWAERLFEPEEALSQSEREGLADHLAVCECCLTERELFLDSWATLDDVEEEMEACPFLRANVWQKIREEECRPKSLLPLLVGSEEGRSWRGYLIKTAAAAAAILLGFGVGRSFRSQPEMVSSPATASAQQSENFLDPGLIELASQDGFSMELFPESTQFTPIDREMMSALAPSNGSREWLTVDRGVVVPLRYISQGLPQRGRKPR